MHYLLSVSSYLKTSPPGGEKVNNILNTEGKKQVRLLEASVNKLII